MTSVRRKAKNRLDNVVYVNEGFNWKEAMELGVHKRKFLFKRLFREQPVTKPDGLRYLEVTLK